MYGFHPMARTATRDLCSGGDMRKSGGLDSFQKKEINMLWTVFVVLLVLWVLGLVSSYTLGGFIHILLVLALVVLVINLLSGRRTAV
jgi:hypothetical protein